MLKADSSFSEEDAIGGGRSLLRPNRAQVQLQDPLDDVDGDKSNLRKRSVLSPVAECGMAFAGMSPSGYQGRASRLAAVRTLALWHEEVMREADDDEDEEDADPDGDPPSTPSSNGSARHRRSGFGVSESEEYDLEEEMQALLDRAQSVSSESGGRKRMSVVEARLVGDRLRGQPHALQEIINAEAKEHLWEAEQVLERWHETNLGRANQAGSEDKRHHALTLRYHLARASLLVAFALHHRSLEEPQTGVSLLMHSTSTEKLVLDTAAACAMSLACPPGLDGLDFEREQSRLSIRASFTTRPSVSMVVPPGWAQVCRVLAETRCNLSVLLLEMGAGEEALLHGIAALELLCRGLSGAKAYIAERGVDSLPSTAAPSRRGSVKSVQTSASVQLPQHLPLSDVERSRYCEAIATALRAVASAEEVSGELKAALASFEAAADVCDELPLEHPAREGITEAASALRAELEEMSSPKTARRISRRTSLYSGSPARAPVGRQSVVAATVWKRNTRGRNLAEDEHEPQQPPLKLVTDLAARTLDSTTYSKGLKLTTELEQVAELRRRWRTATLDEKELFQGRENMRRHVLWSGAWYASKDARDRPQSADMRAAKGLPRKPHPQCSSHKAGKNLEEMRGLVSYAKRSFKSAAGPSRMPTRKMSAVRQSSDGSHKKTEEEGRERLGSILKIFRDSVVDDLSPSNARGVSPAGARKQSTAQESPGSLPPSPTAGSFGTADGGHWMTQTFSGQSYSSKDRKSDIKPCSSPSTCDRSSPSSAKAQDLEVAPPKPEQNMAPTKSGIGQMQASLSQDFHSHVKQQLQAHIDAAKTLLQESHNSLTGELKKQRRRPSAPAHKRLHPTPGSSRCGSKAQPPEENSPKMDKRPSKAADRSPQKCRLMRSASAPNRVRFKPFAGASPDVVSGLRSSMQDVKRATKLSREGSPLATSPTA